MERLTYDFCLGNIHCWQVKGADNRECRQVCEEQENGCKGCPIALAFDRLAAYEDTGLTPEEVQQMRWIPVEERLPEEGKRCLLYTPCDGILYVGYYAGKDKWQHRHKWRLVTAMRSTQTLTKKVTHWRPLPAVPKEEKKDD